MFVCGGCGNMYSLGLLGKPYSSSACLAACPMNDGCEIAILVLALSK